MNNFIIYGLTDRWFNIRYVGLTSKSLKHRLRKHMNDTRHNPHKINWINKYGKTISIVEIENNITDSKIAKEREIHWISVLKNIGCNLLNATEGGDYSPNKGLPARNKGQYKVSNYIINQLKEDYKTGKYSQLMLSKKYNIAKSSIDRYLKLKEIDSE